MIQAVTNLRSAVGAAQGELDATTRRIGELRAEFRELSRLEDEHQAAVASEAEVDRKVQAVLAKIIAGAQLSDIHSQSAASEQAAARRDRIDVVTKEICVLELREELLSRALEAPGMFALPRRSDVDPLVAVAHEHELERAYEAAEADLESVTKAARNRRSRAA